MSQQPKGEFLKEKMLNLAKWVTLEVGKENLAVDVIAAIDGRTVLEVTMVCGLLEANENLTIHRNWGGLVQLMAAHSVPPELQEVVALVRQKEVMHDKFWRYMRLFVDVVRQ